MQACGYSLYFNMRVVTLEGIGGRGLLSAIKVVLG